MPKVSRSLSSPVRLFILVMMVTTIGCLVTETFCRFVLHLPWPYTFPLFPDPNRFADLIIYRSRFQFFHTTVFFIQPGWRYMYPAPLALIYRFFYTFTHPSKVFIAIAIVWILLVSFLFRRALRARGVSDITSLGITLVLICSYALCFELRQANLEFFVWIAISCGVWAFYTERYNTAAACFGVATAMKLFPFVFLGLFIARKQYRRAILSLGFAGLTTLIGLWALCPDLQIAWQGVSSGLRAFGRDYALQIPAFSYDHSLFRLLRACLSISASLEAAASSRMTLAVILSAYLVICATFGIVLYFARIRKLPFANQVLCLTVASILLPPISFDYTLIHLYAPVVLLLLIAFNPQTDSSRKPLPGLAAALVLIALLLAPETELIRRNATVEGQFKACCLVVLFLVGLHYPFKSRPCQGEDVDSELETNPGSVYLKN